MIVLPDGKICRNLPEQVAENLKKIQEIIHFLDGVNIQDNLVVIADLSQILTEAELEIVERPVAFIYYNAELYIKKNEAAGKANFVNVFSIEDTGTQLNFNSNEIEVDLGTGALNYTTATASSYTKSQIDSLLALKANDAEVAKLAGAAFTGAITSPSIIEDMVGYSFFKQTPTTFTEDIAYAGAVKNGNKLTLAVAMTITTTVNSTGFQSIGYFKIPAEIMAKVQPIPAFGTNYVDVKLLGAAESVLNYTQVSFLTSKGSEQLYMAIHHPLVPAGKTLFLRYELTILLSENLAA